MLDEKKIEESSKIILQLIQDGRIKKPKPEVANFFITKSKETLAVSERLWKVQEEEGTKTNVWVINTSYYSMFFAATALLANFDHQIKTDIGIHKLTYHALVYYFIKQNSKLKSQIVEDYNQAVGEAEELLQLGETKIKGLVNEFDQELGKRKDFTYEMIDDTQKNKANTSLERARRFFKEVNNIINKKR